MSVLDDVLSDLTAEGHQLRAAVGGLDPDRWATPTPAPGWSVATQVAHLLWTDEVAALAAAAHSRDGIEPWEAMVAVSLEDPTGYVDTYALEVGALPPATILARWDVARRSLCDALRAVPAGQKMPWFGPPMSPTSMATARLMETWAHALDVYDALGARPEPTDRIRHVAHIGVRTRNFTFSQHDWEAPAEEFRVELIAPSGAVWVWGPVDAAQRVTGSAYEFCQLVTRRIHRDDTGLLAVGEDAERWLGVAQAYVGEPGAGREATTAQA